MKIQKATQVSVMLKFHMMKMSEVKWSMKWQGLHLVYDSLAHVCRFFNLQVWCKIHQDVMLKVNASFSGGSMKIQKAAQVSVMLKSGISHVENE